MASDGASWASSRNVGSPTWVAQEYKQQRPIRSRLRATSSCSSYSEASIGASSSGTDGVHSRPGSTIGLNEGVWDWIAHEDMDYRSGGEAEGEGEGQLGKASTYLLYQDGEEANEDEETSPRLYITPSITLREALVRFIGLILFARIIDPAPLSSSPSSSSISAILWTALSQLLLSMILPEVIWVIRTAHKTRTVVLFHLAWKLYTVLHCTQLAAMVAMLTPGWMMVSHMTTTKENDDENTTFIPSQERNNTRHRAPTTTIIITTTIKPMTTIPTSFSKFQRTIFTILAPLANTIVTLARRLVLFVVVLCSAVLFCAFCALYPHVQNPFALGCVFCTCTVVGLRIRSSVVAQRFNNAAARKSLSNDKEDHSRSEMSKEVSTSIQTPTSGVHTITSPHEGEETGLSVSPMLVSSPPLPDRYREKLNSLGDSQGSEAEEGEKEQHQDDNSVFSHGCLVFGVPRALIRLILSSIAYGLLTIAWCAWLIIMGDIHPELALILLLNILYRWKP